MFQRLNPFGPIPLLLPYPDDVDNVINYNGTGVPGPQGEPGPPGPPGPQGEQGPPGKIEGDPIYNTRLIDDDYIIEQNDAYIGVNSDKPIDILLPDNPIEGSVCIIKLEMGAPIGNRKVTIITDNGAKIDDSSSYVLKTPYEFVTLIYRGQGWHII